MTGESPLQLPTHGRSEYPTEFIESGERGKHAERYRGGTNAILIDADLHRLFPDSASVNHALRKYAEEHRMPLA